MGMMLERRSMTRRRSVHALVHEEPEIFVFLVSIFKVVLIAITYSFDF